MKAFGYSENRKAISKVLNKLDQNKTKNPKLLRINRGQNQHISEPNPIDLMSRLKIEIYELNKENINTNINKFINEHPEYIYYKYSIKLKKIKYHLFIIH